MPSDLLASSSLHQILDSRIERRPLPAGQPVVVYGAGNTGRRVLAYLRAAGIDPIGVLDQRASGGSTLDGVPVHRPGTEPYADMRARATVVVAVFNRDADVRAIDSLLCSLGYGRVVGVVELHDLLAQRWDDDYWLAQRDHSARHAADVLAGLDRLADDASRTLYEQIVSYRVNGSATDAPRPMAGAQYFPADVPRAMGALRFVDCGAFKGEVLESAEREAALEAVCAFEPDAANFAALVEWAAARRRTVDAHLWPCAVWSRTEHLRFDAAHGEASRVAADGATMVQAVAIDDVLPGFSSTDLKMDIEGAEPEALAGAVGHITRCRPRLAVCAYHRPQHLWSLSASIAALELDYAFYLRAHAHGGFEVVLYAIPAEQCAQ
jgi:FkbM family methyltransferase